MESNFTSCRSSPIFNFGDELNLKKKDDSQMNSEIQELLQHCFGFEDLIFAVHQSDQNGAYSLLNHVRGGGYVWQDIENEVVSFLKRRFAENAQINNIEINENRVQEHITTQLAKVRSKIEPWL